MKTLSRTLGLTFLVVLIAAGTANINAKDSSPKGPDIALVPIGPSPDVLNFRGPVDVQYELRVANPSGSPLVLTRLDLRTEGPGAYSLRTGARPLNQRIAAGGLTTIKLNAWGYSHGGFIASDEPVTIRGVAYFKGPSGNFTKVFVQNVGVTG